MVSKYHLGLTSHTGTSSSVSLVAEWLEQLSEGRWVAGSMTSEVDVVVFSGFPLVPVDERHGYQGTD